VGLEGGEKSLRILPFREVVDEAVPISTPIPLLNLNLIIWQFSPPLRFTACQKEGNPCKGVVCFTESIPALFQMIESIQFIIRFSFLFHALNLISRIDAM